MINYYEPVDFNRFVRADGETLTLRDLAERWADLTTTPYGVAHTFFVDGTELWAWGVGGGTERLIETFETEAQAKHALLLSYLFDLDHHPEAPTYEFADATGEG